MTSEPNSPPILLMGPTASGKTGLALALAERLPVEIVSVDSALVYRGLDIGSAKPDAAMRARVPHHLIDILDPAESYSAARFAVDARRLISEIRGRGRVPLLVGGTMLYFRALTRGLSELPAADADVRAQLEADAARLGWPAMHARLAALDPDSAARLHPNDQQRVQRALEIIAVSGTTPSAFYARRGGGEPVRERWCRLALNPPARSELHGRIAARFHAMMADGFLDEVARLHARGDLHPELPAIRAVGYRQLWAHLEGECSREEAVERGIAATRQFAKRQLTWLRSEPDLNWLDPAQDGLLEAALAHFRAADNSESP
ncbi:tRNA (adenosine(37)-N6)-dimethylallyltransferase MiaA [Solimonas terrae]|uniref:tRNA dimethylallyltransferase n=1 Tax=Solimonas terrae TaxID=1396819 RepID=A0A6M2BP87_9GAMM|nr:tRNA (adenosine(37)-N6)-dimethylallyltransferase MiaA [Solimonas terrae]NGY03833.1 tRNA (adenosine(37)-N6)-dimethylallyltransferase MiaA [Solimonas terrae]